MHTVVADVINYKINTGRSIWKIVQITTKGHNIQRSRSHSRGPTYQRWQVPETLERNKYETKYKARFLQTLVVHISYHRSIGGLLSVVVQLLRFFAEVLFFHASFLFIADINGASNCFPGLGFSFCIPFTPRMQV